MFKCPHCNQKSIPFSQKFHLILHTKSRNFRCKKCGNYVTVSFALTLLLIPIILIPLFILDYNYHIFLSSDFFMAMIVYFGTISVIAFIVPLKRFK